MKKLLVAMIVLLGGLLFGGMALAEGFEGIDTVMTISPPKQKIVLIPGEVYEGSIRVSNTHDAKTDLKYSVTIGSFSLGRDENGNVDYNDTDTDTVTGYNQIMNWITLGKESGTVAPNAYDVIPFTITVPKDAPGGGQYATIIVQDDTFLDDEGSGNVNIQNILRFASSIIAEVAGETRNEGTIVENKIPTILLNNKLQASSIVRNDGNVHTDASYVLQVWPLFSDEEICTNEEEESVSMVMPETERYHVESCSLPRIGFYRVKQTVKIFGETSIAEKTIIVCPLWLIFAIVFFIIIVIAYFVSKSKSRKKKD